MPLYVTGIAYPIKYDVIKVKSISRDIIFNRMKEQPKSSGPLSSCLGVSNKKKHGKKR